jgi:tetratricopeptide (TPR) repeat protein
MTSLEEKEKGAAAWSANNFPLAILHFSNAIEIGGEKEFIKVVYSNRSVANLKLNKLVEALADANKCIEIDAKWPKGYTRKGDALYSSKKYTDSFNAYNSAKKLSPSDQSIVEKCDLAMRAIGAEADRTAPSRPSTSGGSRSTATPTTAPPTGILGKIVTYSRYLLLLSAVLYLIPFGRSLSALSFRY